MRLPRQAYMPKVYCWGGRSIQAASSLHTEMCAFMARHPLLRVYSGLRVGDEGDHRCGYALDIVPLTVSTTGWNAIENAAADARRRGYAYVEPLSQTWIPGNHHLHISFKRCPVSAASAGAATTTSRQEATMNNLKFHYTPATILAIIGAAIAVAVSFGLHMSQENIHSILTLAGLVLGGIVVGGGIKSSAMIQTGVHPALGNDYDELAKLDYPEAGPPERPEGQHA